jgi:hypothetical protein
MVKAILLEVYTINFYTYTIGVPPHGLYHIRVKIYTVLLLTCGNEGKGVTITQTRITCINLWKGLPKESVIETKPRTTGSPKGSNSYGDRVPIVQKES